MIGELVAERPARARLFERLHIDYCCGGQQTLAEACTKTGAQLDTVQAALQALGESDAQADDGELTDWRAVETAQLCEHIVHVHHDCLRRTLPRIDGLVDTVVRVHGAQDSTLADVQHTFDRIRSALEPHLTSEETELFPAIIAAEQGGPPVAEDILAGHEYEHSQVGAALVDLRGLCHDYDRGRAYCNTHRALLDALEDLERDLHQHVHEENNVLFLRARRARLRAAGSRRAPARLNPVKREPVIERKQTLPACCQGWIAEQGHRWSVRHR